jgi:DNA adenine methylase
MIPEHFAYVEVFGGSGALLLNKPRSPLEVYNDIDSELVNLFEVVRDDADAFLKRTEFLLYSRELFESWQRELKQGGLLGDRVERAVKFWYLLRTSYGAHPLKGWGFTRSTRSLTESLQNSLRQIRLAHERLRTVQIDHLDFRRCIKQYDAETTFLFLDPPYLDTEDYTVGVFTLQDHEELADLLRSCKSKWLLTIGDHTKIRELHARFPHKSLSTTLAMKKTIGRHRDRLANLVIYNYELPKIPLYVSTAADISLLNLFA